MIISIPTQPAVSAYGQRVTLDGIDYLLELAWNGRDSAWYMNLSDTFGNALVTGIKLVSNRPLLNRFRYVVGLPPGELVAVSLDGSIDVAGLVDLGVSVPIYYFDAAELALPIGVV